MDDDWGLQAVVRGCSAVLSGSGAAISSPPPPQPTTTTTTGSSNTFMSDFDFRSSTTTTNNNNSSNSFLFSSSSSSSSSSSFGSINSNSKSQTSDGFGQLFSLSDPIGTRSQRNINGNHHHHQNRAVVEDLHDLYKPFFVPKPEPNSLNTCTPMAPNNSHNKSILSSNDLILRPLQQQQPLRPVHSTINRSFSSTSSSLTKHGSVSSTTPKSKKRKNQMKKVCQVPAESLSSDIWAWRKYGQKPIKGSPYPRGYYRCSSSKGCLARKQVERNRSDPGMFIVTYTCEHNHPAPTHRNSLAGSTRQKPSPTTTAEDSAKPLTDSAVKASSPGTSLDEELTAALSGSATESKEGPDSSTMLMEDEEDDEFGLSDMAVSDDFFVGLEGLGASVPATGEFFSENSPPPNFGLPWPASSAATAAGGS